MRVSDTEYFGGKLIVIAGGTSGIGFALAQRLSVLGARIVVMSDQPDSVATAVAALSGQQRQVFGHVCDIGVAESVSQACAHVLATHGTPDLLINNAGYATYRTFEQEDPMEVERLMNVNFNGAIRVTKAFLGGMIERRSGQIVNVASIAAVLPLTPNAVYTGTKHGMLGWSLCLQPELARFGIDITVICPGRVETNFFNHETFKARAHRKETEFTIPMEMVVAASLDAIVKRQRVRYVPGYYKFLGWAFAALGPLVRIPFNRLLRGRIEDIYRTTNKR